MGGGNHCLEGKKVKPMQWGMQYAVGMQYTVDMQYAVGMQYLYSMQYAVGVSTKRSTHTVDLANMGSGDLPLVQKGQSHAVGTQYTVGVSA